MPGLVPAWQIQLSTAEKFSDRAKASLAKPTKSTDVSMNDVSTIFVLLSISPPPPTLGVEDKKIKGKKIKEKTQRNVQLPLQQVQ